MRRIIAILVGAVLAVAGCSDGQVQRSDDAAQIGYIEGSSVTTIPRGEREPAPEFGGPLLGRDGAEFNLADARGEIVVLNVWGSWCPPCRKEAPALQAIHEELAEDGVRFVGVNTRDYNTTDALRFEEEFGIDIADDDADKLKTVGDAMEYLKAHATADK